MEDEVGVREIDVDVAKELCGVVRLILGGLVEEQPHRVLGRFPRAFTEDRVVERPLPDVEECLLALERRRDAIVLRGARADSHL